MKKRILSILMAFGLFVPVAAILYDQTSAPEQSMCAYATGYVVGVGYNAYPAYRWIDVRPFGYNCSFRVAYAPSNCYVGMVYTPGGGYCKSGGGGGSW